MGASLFSFFFLFLLWKSRLPSFGNGYIVVARAGCSLFFLFLSLYSLGPIKKLDSAASRVINRCAATWWMASSIFTKFVLDGRWLLSCLWEEINEWSFIKIFFLFRYGWDFNISFKMRNFCLTWKVVFIFLVRFYSFIVCRHRILRAFFHRIFEFIY